VRHKDKTALAPEIEAAIGNYHPYVLLIRIASMANGSFIEDGCKKDADDGMIPLS